VVVAVHRAIEQQAAARGESAAYVDGACTLTYRELNGRANALARALIASGFKRGSVAAVRMVTSADLVVTLLAVLKAGGAYMSIDQDDASWPRGLSIVGTGSAGSGRCLAVDVSRMLTQGLSPSANLPILTRATDVACVLRDCDGSPAVLVPHSTIAALPLSHVPRDVRWTLESGALDLWVALMTGATVTTDTPMAAPVRTVAA
jgi:acyl-CoA synthetase (AMP-forming)/AMP-acid ligase II